MPIPTRKILLLLVVALACVAFFWFMSIPLTIQFGARSSVQMTQTSGATGNVNRAGNFSCPPPKIIYKSEKEETSVRKKDEVDNSGAKDYLKEYDKLFAKDENPPKVPADPNNPDTITTWWQAAAMIDWYINSPVRYECKNKVNAGNWHLCQDEPYRVKPPCLVYSFGINFDFSFDNAMAELGCEVHSFDPSMDLTDHKRGDKTWFHNMGIGAINTDGYVARRDMYVKKRQVWKMRTLKSVVKMLGHENRVIDVLKIDVESYEWDILDNMMETDMFQFIRQFELEFHLFPDYPLRETYVNIYKTYTKLRAMGFREYGYKPKKKNLTIKKFNNQGDCEYVNIFFERKAQWQ